jgi:hypothetical protein
VGSANREFGPISRHADEDGLDLNQALPAATGFALLEPEIEVRVASIDLNQTSKAAPHLAFAGKFHAGMTPMPEKIDDLLPTAKEIQRQAALKEAEKQKLIDKLSKPSGLSEDEKVELASNVIQRAVRNGLKEVQVYRFPNSLCTDKGRAINQMESGWEKTLTRMAKEIYQLWADYLQPRGYRIRYQVIDYPGGVPGDIGITVSWGD